MCISIQYLEALSLQAPPSSKPDTCCCPGAHSDGSGPGFVNSHGMTKGSFQKWGGPSSHPKKLRSSVQGLPHRGSTIFLETPKRQRPSLNPVPTERSMAYLRHIPPIILRIPTEVVFTFLDLSMLRSLGTPRELRRHSSPIRPIQDYWRLLDLLGSILDS